MDLCLRIFHRVQTAPYITSCNRLTLPVIGLEFLTLQHVSGPHFFLWLNTIIQIDPILLLHFWTDGHLNCIHSLAIMNNATLNTCIWAFAWVPVLNSFVSIPRNKMASSFGTFALEHSPHYTPPCKALWMVLCKAETDVRDACREKRRRWGHCRLCDQSSGKYPEASRNTADTVGYIGGDRDVTEIEKANHLREELSVASKMAHLPAAQAW